jgi:hypothetical protein
MLGRAEVDDNTGSGNGFSLESCWKLKIY